MNATFNLLTILTFLQPWNAVKKRMIRGVPEVGTSPKLEWNFAKVGIEHSQPWYGTALKLERCRRWILSQHCSVGIEASICPTKTQNALTASIMLCCCKNIAPDVKQSNFKILFYKISVNFYF